MSLNLAPPSWRRSNRHDPTLAVLLRRVADDGDCPASLPSLWRVSASAETREAGERMTLAHLVHERRTVHARPLCGVPPHTNRKRPRRRMNGGRLVVVPAPGSGVGQGSGQIAGLDAIPQRRVVAALWSRAADRRECGMPGVLRPYDEPAVRQILPCGWGTLVAVMVLTACSAVACGGIRAWDEFSRLQEGSSGVWCMAGALRGRAGEAARARGAGIAGCRPLRGRLVGRVRVSFDRTV